MKSFNGAQMQCMKLSGGNQQSGKAVQCSRKFCSETFDLDKQ